MSPRALLLATTLSFIPVWGADAAVPVVEKGRPVSVVLLPEKANAVAKYAAEELVYHVKKATGAMLPIETEGNQRTAAAGRIYIGATAAARNAGIAADALSPDSFILRTKGNALFIVGHDSEGDPLSPDTWAGTLFGVYELLEQTMGVRWLWPGELGEHIPQMTSVTVADMNKTVSPRLVIRRLRSSLREWAGSNPDDSFSPEAMKKVRDDEAKWLRRQRMGHSRKIRWGHAFTNWWDKFGREHPDWFNLLDGERKPQGGSGESTSMCVSNPGFHRQIIANWLEECAASPNNKPNINACENDVFGRCQCATCKSWDAPRADEDTYPERFSRFGIVSDRYARFWRTIQEMAAQYDPEVIVTGYAYVNYAPPPVREKLNDHVWIGLVPDSFFPRTPEEHKQCLDMWEGWAATGCKLFLRPNYTLEGYCMPFIYIHQFADEFAHHARHGMIATDFDSLTAMWATQGPQQYLFARWQNCLDAPVDKVLAEYYSGFGPAASQVKAYFDFWEDYTMKNRDNFRAIAKRTRANWATFPRMAHECFPPEVFAHGRRLLDDAARAAKGNALATARVEFLRKGLTHAEKCAAASRARMTGDFIEMQRALLELRQYRKEIEKDNVANLAYCAWLEARAFGQIAREVVYSGQPLKELVEKPAPAELQPISLRGDFGCVVKLKDGDTFRARISAQRVGQYEDAIRWSLHGPDKKVVGTGTLRSGESQEIAIPVAVGGMFNLLISTNMNVARLTLLNNHAVILGRGLSLLGASAPLFFYVPAGTKEFKVTFTSPAPGETVSIVITDPEGKEASAGMTGEKDRVTLVVPVPAGQDGRAWSVTPRKGPTGVWEDYTIILGEELPAYWALAPDRLLVPAK